MTFVPGISRKAIRSAGKATLFLQGVAVFLTLVLIGLYADISHRYNMLEDGIRENAMWAVYQLDREARALDFALKHMVEGRIVTSKDLKGLTLRYDILYSRIKLLRDTKYEESFLRDAESRVNLHLVQDEVLGQVQAFDEMAKGYFPPREELRRLLGVSAKLVQTTEKFLLETNHLLSEQRATNRTLLVDLQNTAAIMLALLLLSIVALVIMLRRQLKSLGEVSSSLEIMAKELSDAYKAADAGNRAKSQFMATMGHEIRTPLNAILGTAELLEFSRLPEDAAANVQTIRSSGEALLEIINEILDYSKIEHGKLELEYRAVDVLGLAQKSVEILTGRAAEHGNRLELDLPEVVEPRYVRTDPTRLRQVLLNLLSNAVKFTDKGTVTLRLRDFTRDGRQVLRFEVQDTGIGIDETGLGKLFKPFSQVDASINRKYGGTGLGLTICKQIVETMGGEMGVRSKIGEGSVFWLEIPVVAAEAPEAQTAQLQSEAIARLPRGRVLLVEDNKVNQQVATRFLSKLGQDTVVASNGAEGVEIALSQTFDVILMDMQMPVMDGIEATRQIRARQIKPPPIIAMTANASDDDRRRCMDAGMTGFESKPVTLARLYAVMAEHMARPEDEGAETLVPVLERGKAKTTLLDEARRAELIEALGEDIFNELLEAFFDDAAALLGELHGALAGEDRSHIDRVLHTIKGAASNIGLNDIAELAHDMRDHLPTIAEVEVLADKITSRKDKLAA